MNLQKIEQYIDQFEKYLKSSRQESFLFWWESLQFFQTNWDLQADDLEKMYDRSLQNTSTVRLWKDRQYFPKRMMRLFCNFQPDFVRDAFTDLFNENKEVEGRLDRFLFYCDELLQAYKDAHPLKVENHHYHHYRMLSLYLAFRFPAQYAPYDFDVFRNTMQKLGSRNIPELNDIGRFFKISRTLWKFLQKRENIWTLHLRRLPSDQYYQGEALLLVAEFCQMIYREKI